jgi:TetR/AcrR family acrAB operon transcriptional repressor
MSDTNQTRSLPERERNLLDAAARLFMLYGFDKASVADVAAEAGVSKGAVYLHFDSKDALFEALILREMQAYARSWVETVEADPDGGTIGGMYRCALRALNDNAVMAAMLRRDPRVFGSYMRKPGNLLAASRSGSSRKAFVEAMQRAGAIRHDADPAVTAHIMNMLSYGLVSMAQVMDSSEFPAIDALLEGIADFLDRALTPTDGGNRDAGKAIVRALHDAGAARLARARKGQNA